jgi:hypothetical protein
MYIPYAGVVGMLLHINGKFTMGKLISFLLSLSCVLNFKYLETAKQRIGLANSMTKMYILVLYLPID